jgi:hypothetical protein
MSKARDLANAGTALTTVSATELGYLDGVTSAVQTQINAKQAVVSGVDSTEIGYLDGVTSAIQTQINAQIPKSLLTTTGDVIYASAANTPARLGIGSTGQVLTVAGGVPTWATAGAGKNWSLLSTTSLTGAQTITVSGISGRDGILVVLNGASSATSGVNIIVRPNNDASNYSGFGLNQYLGSSYVASDYAGQNFTAIQIGRNASAAGGVFGYAVLSGCNSTGVKTVQAFGIGGGGAGSNLYNHAGVYSSTSLITSISIFSDSGNLDAGSVSIYTTA